MSGEPSKTLISPGSQDQAFSAVLKKLCALYLSFSVFSNELFWECGLGS